MRRGARYDPGQARRSWIGFQQAVEKRLFVILNEVKDLELLRKTRFLATLRMTKTLPRSFSTAG